MATAEPAEDVGLVVKHGTLELEDKKDAYLDPYYRSLVVSGDNIILANCNACNIRLHRLHDGKLLATSDMLESEPRDICLINDTEICVILWDNIEIMSVECTGDTGSITRVRALSVKPAFDLYDGVVKFMDKVIVCGKKQDNICWCIVSLTEGYLDTVHEICKGDESYLTTRHNMVYISCDAGRYDSHKTGVYAYDFHNPSIHKFIYKHEDLTNPSGLTLDTNGFIFVCNTSLFTPCIHHLTDRCEPVTIYREGIPLYPETIFWNHHHKMLYVTSYGSDVITRCAPEYQQAPIIPVEILRMDEKSLQLYKEALQNGKEKIYNIRVMVVGQYGVGKTTLTKRLLEQRVNLCDRKSTEGIDVYKHCCKVSLDTGEWIVQHEDSDQLSRLQRLVKLLTCLSKSPEVSVEEDGRRENIKQRGSTPEDLSLGNDDNYDNDDRYYNDDDDDRYGNDNDYDRADNDPDDDHYDNDNDEDRYDNDDEYNRYDNDNDDDCCDNDDDHHYDNDDDYDRDDSHPDNDPYDNDNEEDRYDNDNDDERYDNDPNDDPFENDNDDDRYDNDPNDDHYENDNDEYRYDNDNYDDRYDNDDNDDRYDNDPYDDRYDNDNDVDRYDNDDDDDRYDNDPNDDRYDNDNDENYYDNNNDDDHYDNDNDDDRYDTNDNCNNDDNYDNFEDDDNYDNCYNDDDYDNDDTYYNDDNYYNYDIMSNHPKPSDERHVTSQGDTTIEFLQLVNENAEKLKKSMFEYASLAIWDFAGQFVFYTTHQTFLTCRAIYLLVTDLSRQVTDLVRDDQCYFDAEGAKLCEVQDLVEVWMNSIHCCTPSSAAGVIVTSPSVTTTVAVTPVQSSAGGTPSTSTSSGITVASVGAGIALTSTGARTEVTTLADVIQVTPPVILVGTHVDQIQEDKRDGITSMYFQQICRILKDKPTLKHLVDFIAIDNTRYDPQLKRLKDRIFQLASEQPYWGEEVPSSWLPLEEALMKLKASGEKVIPLSLVQELNRSASVPIKTAEEMDLFLRFQHAIGTILYFSAEVLRDKIVLDPQWLIDALKSLITAEMFILMKYPAIRDKWFEFRDNGKLTTELIDAIWTKQHNPEFHENKEHILHLMEKLNIVAKPRSYIEDRDELKEEDYYLAPCMLRQAMPKAILFPESNPQMESTSVLCFVSAGKFLPTPIFHRLIAACVLHWQIATQNQKTLIFCGCCVFDIDHHHRLTLYFRDYIIFAQVAIMGVKDMLKSSKLCSEARRFIIETLREIVGTLGQSLQFEPHIKCPDSVADSLDGLIALSLLKNNENVACHSHDKSHILVSQELVKFWFEDEEHSVDGSAAGPATSPPTSDADRFMCLAYLLVDVGSQVLRKLFLHHTVSSACTLDQYLANNRKSLDKLHRRNILSQIQIDILFPPSGVSTSLETYDITLLSALFRNIVPTLNKTETKLIQSLKGDRNEIYGHASSCQMNINDYQAYWNSVSSTLKDVCKQCGDPVFENDILFEIQRIQVTAIPAGSYLDILKTWFSRIESVEDELLDMKTRLETLESKEASTSET